MRGQCGEEFKPYTSYCEECRYYEYCMKHYTEYMEKEKSPGDNYPLRPIEQEIKNNKEKFKRYNPIVEAEILVFKKELEDITIDIFIKTMELYKEV